MKKLYVILAVVAVLGVAAVSYSVNSGAGSMATEPVDLGEMDNSRLVAMAQGLVKGAQDAPVTIVEFGDYQCPGCGSFASFVKPQIEAAYVESGQARFVFYDFPLVNIHPNAFLAARAARCAADQDAGWEYHEALFANQSEWSPATNPAGDFLDYAEEIGLAGGEFEGCLESDRHADVVTANMRLAEALRVSRTPTVMVSQGGGNATPVPDPTYEGIARVVDGLLGESGQDTTSSSGEDGGDGTGGQGG